MKARMKTLKNNANSQLSRLCTKCYLSMQEAKEKLRENNGQFVMDHAVVFIIIIVLGGVSVGLLQNYLQTDLYTTLKEKLNDFFN